MADAAAALVAPELSPAQDPVEVRAAHPWRYQERGLGGALPRSGGRCGPPIFATRWPRAITGCWPTRMNTRSRGCTCKAMTKAREEFDGDFRMTFHLAPPFLGGAGADGRPKKRAFGQWVVPLFRVLAAMKGLRGTALDLVRRRAPGRACPDRAV